MNWNKYENVREMPWKGEKDPYKIWISEIILQQTRVHQGVEYYNRFIKAFPTVHLLSMAKDSVIFKLWEGLGYYSRCKNIIATAKYISKELQGKFPDTFNEIIKLKGIGSYTASAIASFAFNLPYAVLDGNVFRVLSRFFGIDKPIDNNKGKEIFIELANELLEKKSPGIYNQSIMDFGAIICKPKLPLCNICPLKQRCIAYSEGLVSILPVKQKRISRRSRWMYYFLIEYKDKFFVRRRISKDIWQNLYEFVLIETLRPASIDSLKETTEFQNIFNRSAYTISNISKVKTQHLTHQIINGRLIWVTAKFPRLTNDYELITRTELSLLPFPKFIASCLKD